jgi:hypothetical protein
MRSPLAILASLYVAAALLPACCPCRGLPTSIDPTPVATTPQATTPTASPVPAPATADRARAKQFVKEAVLGSEFYSTGEIVKRWSHPIRASVVEGRSAALPDLRDVIAQLNAAFAGTFMSVQLAPDGDKTAELWIHVAPLATFDAIAAANGFQYAPGNWGYAYAFWNGQHELTKAHVLLASDKLKGTQLRHFTFEEITHALGPLRDSKVFADSVLYQSGSNNGNASKLSPADQQMLHLLYAHLSPGAGPVQVDAAFDANWR